MEKKKDMVSIYSKMAALTTVNGKILKNMVKELKCGLMAQDMMENLSMEIDMAMAITLGVMIVNTMVALLTINSMDLEPMNGPMEDSMKVIGKITRRKVMVAITGPMAANTKVTT